MWIWQQFREGIEDEILIFHQEKFSNVCFWGVCGVVRIRINQMIFAMDDKISSPSTSSSSWICVVDVKNRFKTLSSLIVRDKNEENLSILRLFEPFLFIFCWCVQMMRVSWVHNKAFKANLPFQQRENHIKIKWTEDESDEKCEKTSFNLDPRVCVWSEAAFFKWYERIWAWAKQKYT